MLRTYQPCLSLAESRDDLLVVAGTWLSPLMQDIAQWADILVLTQTGWNDFLALAELRRRRGLRTVFEINDDFRAVHRFTRQTFWSDPGNQAMLMQLAHGADALIFSSDGLEERYAWLHPHHAILPNQLAQVPAWRQKSWQEPRPLIIGWAGSAGHRDDLQQVMPVLRAVHDAYPDVEIAIMAQSDMLELFDDWPAERLRQVPAGGYRDYLDFLATIHIGIAPLQPTGFNLCRSDVKVIEYAAHSVAPVVTDLTPYRRAIEHGVDGLKVADMASLQAALMALAGDPAAARQLAHAAWRKVESGRQEHQHAGRRLHWLAEAGRPQANERTAPRPSAATSRARLMEAFGRWPTPTDRPHRRFWQLHFDRLESDMVVLLGQDMPPDVLAATTLALSLLSPHAYLPQLLAGRAATDQAQGMDFLARAEAILPWACDPPMARGIRLQAAKMPAEADAAYAEAAARAPTWGLPMENRAHLALKAGDVAAGLGHLQAACCANPFNRRPARALAELSMACRDPAPLAGLVDDAQKVPALIDVAEARRVAEALVAMGDLARALPYLEWALTQHPQEQSLVGLLALAYVRRGLPSRARQVMRGVPNDPPLPRRQH